MSLRAIFYFRYLLVQQMSNGMKIIEKFWSELLNSCGIFRYPVGDNHKSKGNQTPKFLAIVFPYFVAFSH